MQAEYDDLVGDPIADDFMVTDSAARVARTSASREPESTLAVGSEYVVRIRVRAGLE